MHSAKLKLAYLNSQYPALSHTFIEQEVRGLREQGLEIHTFSIRPPAPSGTLGEHHEAAAKTTCFILGNKSRVVLSFASYALLHPVNFLKTLCESQKLSAPGLNSRFLHLAYLAEAALLARLLKSKAIRHIHVHMANNGAAVALLATHLDKRLSYSLSVHGPTEFLNVESSSLRAKIKGAVFVRCISEFCRSQLMAFLSVDEWKKLKTVHCGIEVHDFESGRAHFRTRGPLRILSVGRLVSVKGFAVLIDACALLKAKGIDWNLRIIGEGPDEPMLKKRVVDSGLSKEIQFLGPKSSNEVLTKMSQSDVFVLPSFMEGIPIVLMEAMAAGLVAVSSRIAGIPELIESGKNGYLLTPGSTEGLTEILFQIADPRFDPKEIVSSARFQVEKSFDRIKVAQEMALLFQSYLGGQYASSQ